ncbi:conjugal muramidase TrbN/BfpH [Acetobacter malorum DSM 14337]|uniref:Conjugal muramidase TrbN/BfpH n=1 Tax=Acetobacter malorum DSM 14337 TaxID=1307910 RepID=A0ABQ0Q0N1_9PROT|nr:conjugal muramidase TrbN/BfpH [Acetobacter malorum DSM 14337]
MRTEGGRLGLEHRNNNGTYDLGPMQVNSRWMPEVAKLHFNGNQRDAWVAVRDWGCYNIMIGTWVFRRYVDEADGDLKEAVGLYNSHTPKPKRAYQYKFASHYAELFFNKVTAQSQGSGIPLQQGQHG